MNRHKALIDAKLNGLRDAALENKTFLDKHTSSVAVVTSDAKRKWEKLYVQMQNDSRDGSDFSSVKHCRFEAILQQCVNTADTASQQWEKVHESTGEMSAKHVKDMEVVRNTMESNDQHDTEIDTLRLLVDEDAKKHSTEIINHFDAVLEYERESVAGVMEVVVAHSACRQELSKDPNSMASSIDSCTRTTFEHDYMDYEPSGETPLRSEPDLPSKGTIESL